VAQAAVSKIQSEMEAMSVKNMEAVKADKNDVQKVRLMCN